jgi:hypothetical protein
MELCFYERKEMEKIFLRGKHLLYPPKKEAQKKIFVLRKSQWTQKYISYS